MNSHLDLTAADLLKRIQLLAPDFLHFIQARLGIEIHEHQAKELHKTILEACQKFNCSPEEYFSLLKNCSENSPLLEHLVIGITIGETYFFRDKHQMQLLQETVLLNLIKAKREQGNLSLRIWSAGSSSGEEIYTIAMLLNEMLPDKDAWTLQLRGTDINTIALQKAIAGRYSEWSMRSISDYFKKRYFKEEKNQYVLLPFIRDLVSFEYLNLNDDTYPSIFNGTNAQDLILCRNVLIYFSEESIKRLMKKLSASLVEGGYLLLGASDPILITDTPLIFHYQLGTLLSRPHAESVLPTPVISRTEPIEIKKLKPISIPKKMTRPIAEKKLSSLMTKHDAITALLNETKWQEALVAIETCQLSEPKSVFLLSAKATVLANLGKINQARELCEESLKLDATHIQTHFMYAMILVELNRVKEAEAALRKTLFLDHQFVVGHFQLGLLLLRNKQTEAGLKSLQNALAIVKTKPSSQPIPGFQTLRYERLAEILEHEIELYQTTGSHYAIQK